ncbi:hypothetical protein MVEN_01658400 [Mycena venus]|uniref:Uncharacterized protein n=1 Tax=Mycena venus TaxID=2733690 RepID=A0A8H6XPU2_9AGAR|nr:hypothetical protein MVEN_01658400 [Mycena venus]
MFSRRLIRCALAQLRPSPSVLAHSYSSRIRLPPPRQKKPVKLALPLTDEMWAAIEPTTFTVFHNPVHATSMQVLRALETARLEFPPPPRNPTSSVAAKIYRGPLKLEIVVQKRVPTVDEFRALLPFQASHSYSGFMTTVAQATVRETPTNAQAMGDLVKRKPKLLDWPLVVDWEHGECSIGGRSFLGLLKSTANRRRKVLRKIDPEPGPPAAPPPAEWIDYD